MDTNFYPTPASGAAKSAWPADAGLEIYLSSRERELITLVLAGHSNAVIAERLNIQLQTLKNALSVIYDKFGVSTRLQLAVLLLRAGVSRF
jgi:DNA-binding NarL/FixJ family response regulator